MSEAVQVEAAPKKGAEARIKQLLAERYELRKQCEALKVENERLRSELRELQYREQLRKHFRKAD